MRVAPPVIRECGIILRSQKRPSREHLLNIEYYSDIPKILCYSPLMGNPATFIRKLSGGRPPSCRFHSHLCPMAQTLRFTFLGSVMPQSVAATMSQCSNAETNSVRAAGLWRSQCRSLEKPHSDE